MCCACVQVCERERVIGMSIKRQMHLAESDIGCAVCMRVRERVRVRGCKSVSMKLIHTPMQNRGRQMLV